MTLIESANTAQAQTYNVGAGGTYATLNAAVTAYNSMVLTQPVVFLLTDASYTVSSTLNITTNATASSTNTLTIKPAPGVTTTINGSAVGMFNISGDHIIIDGSNNGTAQRNMTINNTIAQRTINIGGSAQANSADNITIKNCILSVNNSNYNITLQSTNLSSGGFFNNITIQNNIIQQSVIGIYVMAETGPFQNGTNVNITGNDLARTGTDAIVTEGIRLSGLSFGCAVQNNNIGNFKASTTSPAKGIIVATACSTVVIKNNTIQNISYTGSNAASPVGIEINSPGGNNILVEGNTVSGLSTAGSSQINGILVSGSALNVVVQKNIVSNITASSAAARTYGIQFNPSSTTNMAKLHNNFIYGIASAAAGTAAGIYAPGSGLRQIVYNTVLLSDAPGISYALLTDFSSTGATDRFFCYNNNLINRSPSITNSYAIGKLAAAVFTVLNYNNYEGRPLGRNGTIDVTTLTEMQTLFGANSVNIPPIFVSATDLHIAASGNEAFDNKGTPIAGILTDIDDSPRSATTPDIGADEFGDISGAALVINCTTLTNRICPGTTFNLAYSVQGGTPAAGNIFTAQLSSVVGDFTAPTNIGTISSVATSGSIPVTIPANASGSFYRIRVNSSTPAYTGNDNGSDIVIQSLVTGSIIGTAAAVAGTEYPYSVTARSGNTYTWGFSGGNQNTGGTTNSVTGTFNTIGNQQVSVFETDPYGCRGATVSKTVFVTAAVTFNWTGAVSTEWENPANWSGNQVPGAGSNVVIPAGRPRYPIVSVNTAVKSMTTEPGTSVDIATGINLTVIGN